MSALAPKDKYEGDSIALLDVRKPGEAKIIEVLWKRDADLDVIPRWPVFRPGTRQCFFEGEEPRKEGENAGEAGSIRSRGANHCERDTWGLSDNNTFPELVDLVSGACPSRPTAGISSSTPTDPSSSSRDLQREVEALALGEAQIMRLAAAAQTGVHQTAPLVRNDHGAAGALRQLEPAASTQFFHPTRRPALVEVFATMRDDRDGPLDQSEFPGHHETHGVSVPASRLWFLRSGLVVKLILLGCSPPLPDGSVGREAGLWRRIRFWDLIQARSWRLLVHRTASGLRQADMTAPSPSGTWPQGESRRAWRGVPSRRSAWPSPDGSILAAAGLDGTLRHLGHSARGPRSG